MYDNKKFPDFMDVQSLRESIAMLFSIATFLRVAQGEVCSVNTRTNKSVFSGKEAEGVIKAFDKLFKILRKANDAFVNRVAELDKAAGNSGSDKGPGFSK